jgi:hypothetical protein
MLRKQQLFDARRLRSADRMMIQRHRMNHSNLVCRLSLSPLTACGRQENSLSPYPQLSPWRQLNPDR